MKLTDHTCACNDLTNFEREAQATEDGSYVNMQNFNGKTREITLVQLIFWRFF